MGGTVHGVVFKGLRHDTGDKADHLRTVVRMACERPDLGPEFMTWLRAFVAESDATLPGHRDAAARPAKASPDPGHPTCEDPGTRPGSAHGLPVSRWAGGSR